MDLQWIYTGFSLKWTTMDENSREINTPNTIEGLMGNMQGKSHKQKTVTRAAGSHTSSMAAQEHVKPQAHTNRNTNPNPYPKPCP